MSDVYVLGGSAVRFTRRRDGSAWRDWVREAGLGALEDAGDRSPRRGRGRRRHGERLLLAPDRARPGGGSRGRTGPVRDDARRERGRERRGGGAHGPCPSRVESREMRAGGGIRVGGESSRGRRRAHALRDVVRRRGRGIRRGHPGRALRAVDADAHDPTRHHAGADGRGGGAQPRQRLCEPACAQADADRGRGRARLADGGEPVPAPRLLAAERRSGSGGGRASRASAPRIERPRVRIAGSGAASDCPRLGDRTHPERFDAKARAGRDACAMAGIRAPARKSTARRSTMRSPALRSRPSRRWASRRKVRAQRRARRASSTGTVASRSTSPADSSVKAGRPARLAWCRQ